MSIFTDIIKSIKNMFNSKKTNYNNNDVITDDTKNKTLPNPVVLCNKKSIQTINAVEPIPIKALPTPFENHNNVEKDIIKIDINIDTGDYSLEEADKKAREKSDFYYNRHVRNIEKFDPYNVDKSIIQNTSLSEIEKSFLSYMAGRPVSDPYVAQYWEYEYNIDFYNTMSRFFNEEYLKISNGIKALSYLKVIELKDILRINNLPVSGKKNDLIKRISDNIPIDTININLKNYNRFYELTSKGVSVTIGVFDSATKDIEFENECINYILNNKFDEAYKRVCEFENSKQFKRGINIDWDNELKRGLLYEISEAYTELFNEETKYISNYLSGYLQTFKASVILGHMLCISYDKIKKIFLRLSHIENLECDLIAEIAYTHSMITEKIHIEQFKKLGVKKVELLIDDNDTTCLLHKSNIIKIDEAIPGINIPPFKKGCKCTITPYQEFRNNCNR